MENGADEPNKEGLMGGRIALELFNCIMLEAPRLFDDGGGLRGGGGGSQPRRGCNIVLA